MRKTVLNKQLTTALWTALVLTLGISISACSSEKETSEESGEVLAVDRVDAAADLARKNGPEAEDMDFPETAPMPAADDATMTTIEASATSDSAANDMPEASTDMATTDASEPTNTDTPADDTAEAKPAGN